MPTVLQFRRGTTLQNNSYTGAAGELTIDTDLEVIRVHDGSVPGGFAQVGATAVQTLTNKTIDNAAIINGIRNGNANGVGNIGDSTTYFNTAFVKATSAQYADLAEKYTADQSYAPGTVVELGGSAEVQASQDFASGRVCGIVSTNPAFIMNSGLESENAVVVALVGRVPCRVKGIIAKGDLLCSSDSPGVATRLPVDKYVPGVVVGKAIEDYNSNEEGTIEVLVGRL